MSMKAGASRLLKFISLTDANVYERRDGGLNESGEKTQSRMAIERMLDKTKDVDGKPFKAFALAEEPEDVFHPDDPFDRKLLKDDDGNWKRPSRDWLIEREKRIGKRADSAERAANNLKQMTVNSVVDGLAKLVGQQQPLRPPREQRQPKPDQAPGDDKKPGGAA